MDGSVQMNEAGQGLQLRHLFTPVRLGPLVSKNRIMRVATTANLAEGGRAKARMRAFYARAAEGGAGVLISESVRLHPHDTVVPGAIALFDRGVIPGMRKISRAIHDQGAGFLIQLNHGGRQHLGRRVGTLISASDIPCPRSFGTPHALSTREVEELVEYFLAAAVTARDCDADGVEIHGAQGHLIGQFLSPYSNTRTDRYGGSFENRTRFLRDILIGVRHRLGATSTVGVRLAAEEFTPGGNGVEEACAITDWLRREGLVDYISLSQGNFNTIDTHLPDRHWPILAYRDIQTRIKDAAGPDLVVVQSTRIQTPEQAEEVLAAGQADMIGLCRALIADPDWPAKAKAGRPETIRRCIACNQCWDWISSAEPIGCAVNPRAGREHLFRHSIGADGGTVVVVGGGPAGLEAARVVAERGYHSVLFEAAHHLGGKFHHSPHFPNGKELAHVTQYLIPAARAAGVEIRTGETAKVDKILALRPHGVILATGAAPFAPDVPCDGSVPIRAPISITEIEAAPLGGESLVVVDEDGYFWPAAVTEAVSALAQETGRRLILVTRQFEPFRELPMVSRIATLRQIDSVATRIITSTDVSSISQGSVSLRHYLSGREEVVKDVAAVFWIGRQKARNELHAALKAAGVDRVRLVGDAFAPRRLPIALVEAHSLARTI